MSRVDEMLTTIEGMKREVASITPGPDDNLEDLNAAIDNLKRRLDASRQLKTLENLNSLLLRISNHPSLADIRFATARKNLGMHKSGRPTSFRRLLRAVISAIRLAVTAETFRTGTSEGGDKGCTVLASVVSAGFTTAVMLAVLANAAEVKKRRRSMLGRWAEAFGIDRFAM